MILDAARLAFANLFATETRTVFWKVIGLTLLALVALWFALRELFVWLALPWIDALMPGTPDWAGWLTFVVGIFASLGLALALALLLAPVTALIAGFFLDDVAEVVEKRDYPGEAPGTPLPLAEAITVRAKFLGVVILANIVRLFLLLVPGVQSLSPSSSSTLPLVGSSSSSPPCAIVRPRRRGLPCQTSLDRFSPACAGGLPSRASAQPADAALGCRMMVHLQRCSRRGTPDLRARPRLREADRTALPDTRPPRRTFCARL